MKREKETARKEMTDEGPPGLEANAKSEQEARKKEQRREQEAREEEQRRAQEAREEQRRAQEAREE